MPGRKRKDDDELRKHSVSCRLTDSELSHIDKIKGGMTRGEWLRQAAFGAQLPRAIPDINLEAWREMARVGANLNQAMKYLNSGDELASVQELLNAVKEFRFYLIGGEQ